MQIVKILKKINSCVFYITVETREKIKDRIPLGNQQKLLTVDGKNKTKQQSSPLLSRYSQHE